MAANNRIDLKSILNDTYSASSSIVKNFMIIEIAVTFSNRRNIDWFIDIDAILSRDNADIEATRKENSFKCKFVKGVAKTI